MSHLAADVRSLRTAVLALPLVLGLSGSASALTIDFDNYVLPAGSSIQIPYSLGIGGYVIDAPGGELFIDAAGYANRPDNGSPNLVARRLGNQSVDLRIQTQSGPFDLLQLDLAELFNPGTGDPLLTALTIQVTGWVFGGGVVQQQIVLDNFSDGPGGGADFETFSFDSSWSNLTQVVLHGTSPSYSYVHIKADNIELQPTVVPEPSTALLLGLGLAGIATARHRGTS